MVVFEKIFFHFQAWSLYFENHLSDLEFILHPSRHLLKSKDVLRLQKIAYLDAFHEVE